MAITKKERFIRAHFKLLKMYIYNRKKGCPLCKITGHECSLCTQMWVRSEEDKKYIVHLLECGAMLTLWGPYRLRARYHLEAIKILRTIPKERFTKAGHIGFPELFKLDAWLWLCSKCRR